MNSYRYLTQPDPHFAFPSTAQVANVVAGGFLVFFLLFILLASLLKRYAQHEAAQIEVDRQFLERIWKEGSHSDR